MIRAATVDDAAAIASIQARAWRHAYADIVEPERMPDPAEQGPRLASFIADGGAALVAEVDARVAGFVILVDAELWAIYVDPSAQGAGLGSELLRAAEDALRAAGHAEAVLWTLEANGLARAFYVRHGWVHEPGAVKNDPPEVRYRRTL